MRVKISPQLSVQNLLYFILIHKLNNHSLLINYFMIPDIGFIFISTKNIS